MNAYTGIQFGKRARMTRNSSLAAIAACGLALGGPAAAQDAAPPADDAATAGNLGDIVVTARKRAESLQEVPSSISAFSAEDVQALKITSPADIAAHTPGLNAKYASGFENPVFTMRGIGLNDVSSINNPTVGVYFDDTFVPFMPMMNAQLYDIERVEVLKGPQGTLYGRNTTGGAVKFITRRPSDELQANIRADYSSWSTLELEAGVGGPISDTLKGRVSLYTRQRLGGYMFNRFTGSTVGRQNRIAGRIQLEWSPTPEIDVLLNVHGGDSKNDAALREHIGFKDPVTAKVTCDAVLAGDRGGCTDTTGYADNDGDPFASSANNLYGDTVTSRTWGTSLTASYDMDFAKLISVTSYDYLNRHYVDDNDASPTIQFELNIFDKIKVFSQEVRLVSNNISGLKWVAGVFYSWDRVINDSTQAVDDLYKTRVSVFNDQTTKSVAGFANGELPLFGDLSLNAGIRLTREVKTRYTLSQDLNPFGTSLLSSTANPTVYVNRTDQLQHTDLSGNVGLKFRPSSNFMAYVSAAKGFKSGGFKGAISFNPSQAGPYQPETLYAYEAGFKSTLFDGTLRLNAAAYFYNWENFQAYSLQLVNNVAVVVLTNAGTAHVKGLEADITWAPTPELRISTAFNYMDGKIVNYVVVPGGQDNNGKRLPNAPSFTWNTMVSYTFPERGDNWRPFIQAEANYQSRVYFEIQNNPINSQAGYWLANLRVGARSHDERWEFAAYARNLFNKTYIAESRFIDLKTFPSSNVYGEPRSFGASLSFKY
ncbi:MAG: TonB-dependent receptor [Novosphingobium sp.]